MQILNRDYHKLSGVPASDGFHMPAEFEEQDGCLMIWPYRAGSWRYGAGKAREAFCEIIHALSRFEDVYVFVRREDLAGAKAMLFREVGKNADRIHLIEQESDDAWARDTGATFVVKKTKEGVIRRGIDWQFNAWGGTYDGLYASWEKDQEIASSICRYLGDACYDARHLVLEGGSIHTDGEGTILTTEECLLSPGRNPDLSKEEIERELCGYLGALKVIWLPYGIYNDETNGHIDNICCFTAPGEVALAWTDDESDPQYERSMAAYRVLTSQKDAKGRSLTIHKLKVPAVPISITKEDLAGYEFEEGEDEREVGERLAASYVNFYIGNSCVLVPQFGDANDAEAVRILGECFPGRQIIPIAASEILAGGGNIHCITQQIPKAGR